MVSRIAQHLPDSRSGTESERIRVASGIPAPGQPGGDRRNRTERQPAANASPTARARPAQRRRRGTPRRPFRLPGQLHDQAGQGRTHFPLARTVRQPYRKYHRRAEHPRIAKGGPQKKICVRRPLYAKERTGRAPVAIRRVPYSGILQGRLAGFLRPAGFFGTHRGVRRRHVRREQTGRRHGFHRGLPGRHRHDYQ